MLYSKRVLVTGAAGFIGSHLVEALVELGARVTCLVRYNSASSVGNLGLLTADSRAQITVAAGNIEDSDFVQRTVEGQEIVLHLAALIGIPYSYVAPRSYVRTNVEGTLNVLESARRCGVGRVVHTSTSEVYGSARRMPIDEEHPLQGQSPYSASKIAADKLAECYHRSFNTPVVTLRPFNTFGPRQSTRAFIPTIITQVLAGDTVRLGALTPKRDMTYVTDTVDGFIRAATAAGIEGETINLGTGEMFSVGEFAERILALMGSKARIECDPARRRPAASEVMALVSNNGKARRLLSWKPDKALDDGLRATIDFVERHRELYQPHMYAL
jgi:NAD dependent epimerase/dehydratase